MACYHPIQGWLGTSADGKQKWTPTIGGQSKAGMETVEALAVPCGKCIGCKLDRTRVWSTRCVHEASLYDDNCFITLTFDDDHIPKNGSLVKSDFVNFMKRLRKVFNDRKIRFYHCGEYGTLLQRPHHHACLFNLDFPDKVLWRDKNGVRLYSSKLLEKIWQNQGFCTVGDVTPESAAYIAGYCTKKINGKDSKNYYGNKIPEYTTMSRNPGLGKDWLKKYHDDVYTKDICILSGGYKLKPPRYYDKLLNEKNPEKLLTLKQERIKLAKENPHNTPERLAVREDVAKRKRQIKERTYEYAN